MKLGFSEKMWNTKGCCEARVDVNSQGRRVGEGERRGRGRGGGIHTKAEAIDRHQLLVNHDDPHRGSDIEKPCSNIQSCFPVCFACRVPIRLPNNRGCHLLLPPPTNAVTLEVAQATKPLVTTTMDHNHNHNHHHHYHPNSYLPVIKKQIRNKQKIFALLRGALQMSFKTPKISLLF